MREKPKASLGRSRTKQDDGSKNNKKPCVSPISISSSKGKTGDLFRKGGGVSGVSTHGGSSNNLVSSTGKSSRGLMAHDKNSPLGEGSGPFASAADGSLLKTRALFQHSGGDLDNERCGINLNLQKENTMGCFQRSVQSDNDKNLPNAKEVARQADYNTTRDLFGHEKTALRQGSTIGKTPPKGVSGTTSKTPSKGVFDDPKGVSGTTGETSLKGISGTTGETSSKGVSGTIGGTPPKGVSSTSGGTNSSLEN